MAIGYKHRRNEALLAGFADSSRKPTNLLYGHTKVKLITVTNQTETPPDFASDAPIWDAPYAEPLVRSVATNPNVIAAAIPFVRPDT